MAILVLSGSPRPAGVTTRLVEAFLEGFGPGPGNRVVRLAELGAAPCTGCGGCAGTGRCVIRDGMDRLYPLLAAARGLVLASPLYFSGVTAQAKAVIDRCQCLWEAARLPGHHPAPRRPGAFLSVGGRRRPGSFDGATATARAFLATAGYDLDLLLLEPGLDDPEGLGPDHLRRAREAGARFAELVATPNQGGPDGQV